MVIIKKEHTVPLHMELENINQPNLSELIYHIIECAICCSTLRIPKETSCCHSMFCSECIATWLNNHQNPCPSCRGDINHLTINIPIQRLIEQIPMTCCYKVRGCNSCPSFKDYENHIAHCEFKNANVLTSENNNDVMATLHDIMCKLPENPKQAKDLLNRIHPQDNESRVLHDLANSYYILLTGNPEDARINYIRILNTALPTHGENHANVIECYEKLALIERKLGKYAKSIEYYTKVMNIVRSVPPVNEDFITHCMVQMADVKRKIGDFTGAELNFKAALIKTSSPADKITCWRGLGLICKKNCKYDEALDYYQQAEALLNSQSVTAAKRDLGILYVDIGDVYRKKENHGTACDYYRKALQNLEATTGIKNLDTVDIYCSMALSSISLQNIADAETYVNKSLDILRTINTIHYKSGIVLSISGLIKSMRGEFAGPDGSKADFEKAIHLLIQTSGEDDLEVADTRIRLVEAALKEQADTHLPLDVDYCIDMIRRAEQAYRKKFGANHYKIEQCQTFLFLVTENYDSSPQIRPKNSNIIRYA